MKRCWSDWSITRTDDLHQIIHNYYDSAFYIYPENMQLFKCEDVLLLFLFHIIKAVLLSGEHNTRNVIMRDTLWTKTANKCT